MSLLFLLILLSITSTSCVSAKPIEANTNSAVSAETISSVPVASPTKVSTKDKRIWSGQSKGYSINWNSSNINIEKAGGSSPLLSLRALAESGFKEFSANVEPEQECSYERKFSLLSVVGSIVSFKDELYSFCKPSAHPSIEVRFTSVDMSRSGELVYKDSGAYPPLDIDLEKSRMALSLTDIFPEAQILKALLADPVIKKTLSGTPKSLAELAGQLEGQTIESGKCGFELRKDYLTRFAFHHVEKNMIAVRLGLPPNSGACRTQHAQIGLLLPIPSTLKEVVTLADLNKEGFLMVHLKRISGDQTATIEFTNKKKAASNRN
jgi:hypothetical protein